MLGFQQQHPCRLWVNKRLRRATRTTSAVGGTAEEIGTKADMTASEALSAVELARRPWRTIELLLEPAGFAFARGLGFRLEVQGVIFSGNLRGRQQTTRVVADFSQGMVVPNLIVTSSGIPE